MHLNVDFLECYETINKHNNIVLCLLTDFYHNILIQHNGIDHIKVLRNVVHKQKY